MAMPWVRLDTGLPDHPKILALIEAKKQRAALVYVFGLAYSGRHETDGFVPKMALPFIHASTADANALVELRLWHHTEGGYQINDWDEYQPTSEASRHRQESLKRASRKGGCIKNHGPACGCWKTDKVGG
jgi:hypothetical protein